MPAIVVERYQTGRYASNPACEQTYLRSLEKVGQSEGVSSFGGSNQFQGQNSSLNSDQLQAIGQAVAAQSRGGNISISQGKGNTTGTGAKESPVYVIVEESIGSTLFKWAKFFFWFGLVTYLSMVLITLVIETTGILKKVGAVANNEAQPQHQTVRFSDVHGCDEAKEELQELVEFLKDPEKFSTLGGKLPKGVLLVGPPGTGKTLLARAVAGEAGVPFFFMSGSEFDEVYVGVGAKRIRELFNSARAKAPAIIFIDELDAVGGKRNERDAAYVKQTLNQLLTELDGFSQQTGVIILAATNFPQLLDKALTRPGRFDRHVVVPLPDVRGRMDILKHHMKNVQIGTDVDETAIARGTPGFSGADLENLVNQAAVRASRNKQKKVGMLDFDWAKDKIMMGAERRSAIIQQKDKVMTAYHEGGHALVAMFTEGANPVYKATIMPRGTALGMTHFLPEMDQVSKSKKQYIAEVAIAMGGKVAEELIYGQDNVSSGASGVGLPLPSSLFHAANHDDRTSKPPPAWPTRWSPSSASPTSSATSTWTRTTASSPRKRSRRSSARCSALSTTAASAPPSSSPRSARSSTSSPTPSSSTRSSTSTRSSASSRARSCRRSAPSPACPLRSPSWACRPVLVARWFRAACRVRRARTSRGLVAMAGRSYSEGILGVFCLAIGRAYMQGIFFPHWGFGRAERAGSRSGRG